MRYAGAGEHSLVAVRNGDTCDVRGTANNEVTYNTCYYFEIDRWCNMYKANIGKFENPFLPVVRYMPSIRC